jgi:hypothetical protein
MNPFPPELIETLLNMSESASLDFKRDQYPLAGANDEQKSELVKDIVAFANAWKTSDAYIVIGVNENPGQRATVVGVTDHPNDAVLQQLVNTKTNAPVDFEYAALTVDGKSIGVIRISNSQQRPIFLKKNFGRLRANTVYVRRGSSTSEAAPDEIARMGAANVTANQPVPQIALDLGDPVERQIFGASATVVSKVLRKQKRLVDTKHPVVTKHEDLFAFAAISSRVSLGRKLGRIDPKKLAAYRTERALFDGLGFHAKNTGRVLIEDARIVVEIPKHDGLRVLAQDELPERPRSPLDITPYIRPPSDTWVRGGEHSWEISSRLGKIQPDATVWSDPFYIGSTVPVDLVVTARIFGDNISRPIDVSLTIGIEVEEHFYDKEYDGDVDKDDDIDEDDDVDEGDD